MNEEIRNLISLKQEGGYWDFKKEWHNNHTDLLHDIICFANNLVNRDCYIIIGVNQENDYSIEDVTYDTNRKTTQNLVDFLKDKKFAGGVRPLVLVESIAIGGKTIDVIVIRNGYDTPYFLTESYQGVFKNNIYTRVMDTNTPKPGSADVNHIEYLWKKRFRMLDTPLERFHYFLQKSDEWDNSPLEYEDMKFYRYAPEFRIVTEADDTRDGYEFYLFTQTDPRPHWYTTTLYYHQTPIESFQELAMDGGRWCAIAPKRSTICEKGDYSTDTKPHYGYYIKGSLRYTLHLFLNGAEEEPYEYKKYMELMLVFEDEEERFGFEEYVRIKEAEYERIFAQQKTPYMQPIPQYNMSSFEHDIKSSKTLKQMLEDYRILCRQ